MNSEKECDGCKIKMRFKYLGRINGNYYCKKCRFLKKKEHRKETIKSAGIEGELRELKNKINREHKYYKKKEKDFKPKIKGSKKTRVDKNNCYITFEEKKNWFRILLERGLEGDEAKERVNELVRSQRKLRNKMVEQKKSESEIKIKEQELLEELWKY